MEWIRNGRSQLLLALVLLLTGCSKAPLSNNSSVCAPPAVSLNATTQSLVNSNSLFATDAYTNLAQNNTGNIIFSPFSLSTALQMTYTGAAGTTASQMATVLHLSQAQSAIPQAFASLSMELRNSMTNCEVTFTNADSLWAQNGFPFLPSFTNGLDSSFAAPLNLVDFTSDPSNAVQSINNWVSNETNGTIPTILSSVPPGTVFVILNAIYFKGSWSEAFPVAQTQPGAFWTTTTTSVQVPFMNNEMTAAYTQQTNVSIAELPYMGNSVVMDILLPTARDGLASLEASLSQTELNQYFSDLTTTSLSVSLPKFTFTGNYDLSRLLNTLGMSSAFTSQANFSNMDGNTDLQINGVSQKAYVEVDETGTVASAATSVTGTSSAFPVAPSFTIDHPSLFLIRDLRTQSILFMGRLSDPSQSQ